MIIRGPNGSGKSTLLRILAGLKTIDSGKILWNDMNISRNHSDYVQNIAWLSHQDSLKPALSIKENLSLTCLLYKTNLQKALKAVNLTRIADIPIRMLSAGQKRRAAIARVLLKPAQLWLLDEPSVGLDQDTVQSLSTIFADFQSKGGMIITSTHIPLPLKNSKTIELTPLHANKDLL